MTDSVPADADVNRIGSVAVVPAGIASDRYTNRSPLNGVPAAAVDRKLKVTASVPTVTPVDWIVGIPLVFTY